MRINDLVSGYLRDRLRELPGNVEAGLDQPQREGKVDDPASGRALGDPDADEACLGAAHPR